MKRIDTSTRAIDLFGAGKDGFKDGNLGLGIAPTDFNASWPNMIQEEIANVIEDLGVALNPANRAQLLAALKGRWINTQVFTATGTYTPTPGTKKIHVRMCGGGSSGYGVPVGGSGLLSAGSGGGAGSFAEAIYLAAFAGVIVTIGAGGAGVANNQTLGGASSFGALLTCPGGAAGSIKQIATTTVVDMTAQGLGGAAPTGSGIVFASAGACGQSSILMGTANDSVAGMGGATPFGGGSPNTSAASGPGRGYGSGGSGCVSRNGDPARAGGNGAPGICIIEEFA